LIVILEDPVFDSSPTSQLLSVIQFGVEGWHLIQTDPVFDPAADRAVNRWLAAQDRSTREEVDLVFAIGVEEESLGSPSTVYLRIGEASQSDWSSVPPRMPMEPALGLLRKPLRLLVENRQNDGAFLRRVIPEPWRRKLLRSMDNGWVEIAHGGGSDMRSQISASTQEEALRLWALFDSDAREPGRPSPASEELRGVCLEKQVPHHRLQRRAIENYLPVKALEAWVHISRGSMRTSRRKAVAAFASMPAAHRHHYNMKGGFERDRRDPSAGIPELYGELAEHKDLQSGFATDIAVLFQERDFRIREEWLAKDGNQQEALHMVQSIFRHL
jgi:hypothetical protein